MKKILLIALVATMALASTACSSSDNNTSKPVTGSIEATTETPTEEPTVAELQAQKPGNYIEQDNLKITLEKAVQYDKIESDYISDEPDAGKKYLVLFMEAENISDEDQYINMFYTQAYVDDYEVEQDALIVEPEGYGMFSGDLAPGKKLKGYVCYQVDPDWKSLEFTYTDGILDTSATYDFIVTPDDLT